MIDSLQRNVEGAWERQSLKMNNPLSCSGAHASAVSIDEVDRYDMCEILFSTGHG